MNQEVLSRDAFRASALCALRVPRVPKFAEVVAVALATPHQGPPRFCNAILHVVLTNDRLHYRWYGSMSFAGAS
jgi:hypothetical protein